MTNEELQAQLMQLAFPIDEFFNPDLNTKGVRRIGFLLCAFEFGEPGAPFAFLSNATQETLGPAIRELLVRMAEAGAIVSIPVPAKS